ncbi:hypothetical protein HY003_03810 [Candidatus Saccharibacteria bacterium]|nr:hypothetical protein [Candidatus Saccharibacteria bacterium]MBI3338398.1 hypothetical protein [Candidatus Saccharibacteria bacterium]
MSDDQFTLLDLRKAPPSPDQLISAGGGLPSIDVAKATFPSVKPLSARADLPWERVISPKSSKVPEKSGPTLVTVSKDT